MKIQKQISPCILKKHEWAHMNARVASQRREKNCTERYLRGLENRNGEHLVNMCESNHS